MSLYSRSQDLIADRFALTAFVAGALIIFSATGVQAQGRGQRPMTPSDTGTGSIVLTTLSPVTQNFDTLSNTAGSTTNTTLPTGWYLTETGGGARDNEQYAVDTGGSTTGDTYSYGAAAATERAFGSLRSGTLIPVFGAKFTNNTGSTITSLAIAYTGEEWRLGLTGRADQLSFEISTNATDLSTGTYVGNATLSFTSPDTAGTAGARDGNSAADRTALSATINGLNIPNGSTFFIRWLDQDATGADDGLAIDDFSITPGTALAANVSVSGRVLQADGRPVRGAAITMTNTRGQSSTVMAGRAGAYRFDDVATGESYTISVASRRFSFITRVITVEDELTSLDLVADQ